MGFFDIFKKKNKPEPVLSELKQAKDFGSIAKTLSENNLISKSKDEFHNSLGEDLRHLTEDGELPFGWVYYKKDVVDQIDAELAAFRKAIHEAKEPAQRLAALNDYFQYLEDGKKHYYSIGSCEGKYFEEYIVNSEETNGNRREMKWVKRDMAFQKKLLGIIKKNPGILQKDVYQMFDAKMKARIHEELQTAEKNNVIIRQKSGNTYKLFVK